MYGIVNKAIEEFVCDRFGLETWDAILARSTGAHPAFVSALAYDDRITFDLIAAGSDVCSMPESRFMEDIGAHWAGALLERFPETMHAGSGSFETLLDSLEGMRGRILLLFPDSVPPRFSVTHLRPGLSVLRYFSNRPVFASLVHGVIRGLARHLELQVDVARRDDRGELVIRWSVET